MTEEAKNLLDREASGLGQPPEWCTALIAHLRSQMPTIEELQTLPDDAGPQGIGPELSVPAMHIHLLMLRIEHLELIEVRANRLFGKMAMTGVGPETEFSRAKAVRQCAASIIDNVGGLEALGDRREALIRHAIAKISLLPLAPVGTAA